MLETIAGVVLGLAALGWYTYFVVTVYRAVWDDKGKSLASDTSPLDRPCIRPYNSTVIA